MKEIKAIIQPFMLDKVLEALEQLGELPGLTVSQVAGWGKTRAHGAAQTVTEGGHDFAKKTKLEIVVGDDIAPRVVEIIARVARTGQVGDGKIFVYDVADAIKIRTGERGPAAV